MIRFINIELDICVESMDGVEIALLLVSKEHCEGYPFFIRGICIQITGRISRRIGTCNIETGGYLFDEEGR